MLKDFSRIAFAALYWKMINPPNKQEPPPENNDDDNYGTCGCIVFAVIILFLLCSGSCSG